VITNTPKTTTRPIFPFTAIVGQDEMKLALALNVIDPKIGGVIIMGDRGTGKSTTIRAITDILPEIDVVTDDPFNSHPSDYDLMSDEVRCKLNQGVKLEIVSQKVIMVDLPLGATEDRVCGTIDIEKLLPMVLKLLNQVFWLKHTGVFFMLMKLICWMITWLTFC
jgi:magnesium chelatase subunit I